MHLVHEQEVVKTFFTYRSHPAFGIGICIGRSHWSWDDMNAFRLEHVVKRIGVFAVMVTNQEAKCGIIFIKFPQKLSGLLGNPG